ncbi:MAG: glycosyltransferase family 39 protein [Planctomycetota bacterium]
MHPKKNKYHWLALGTLFVFQLSLCCFLYFRQGIVSRDSLIFLTMAKSASQGDWDAFFATGHHPLYPLLIAFVHSFSGGTTDDSFIWSGQLLSFTAYILSGFAIYQIAKSLFSPFIGIIAYLLAIFQPYFCRETGDVLTDLPYLAFFLWGFYALYIGFLKKRPLFFFLAGICGSCAYLVRPEGLILLTFVLFWSSILFGGILQKHSPQSAFSLLFYIAMTIFMIGFSREIYPYFSLAILLIPILFILLGIWIGWFGYLLLQPSFLWCSSWSKTQFLAAISLFLIPFLPPTLTYMNKIGGISLKQRSIGERLVQFLKKADPGSVLDYKPDSEIHKQTEEIQNTPLPNFRFVSSQNKSETLLWTFIETAHPYLSLLFFGVLIYRVRQILDAWIKQKATPYPEDIFFYFAFFVNGLVLWSVNHSAGYIARRHNFSLIALSLPYSAYGIYWVARILYKKIPQLYSRTSLLHWTLRSPKRIQRYKTVLAWGQKTCFGFWLVFLLFLSAFTLTMKGLKPIESGHLYLRQLSIFMRESYGTGTLQMGNLPRIAFYADGKNVPFTKPVGENGLTDLQDRKIDFILIKEDFLTTGSYEVVVSGQNRLIQFWLKKQWIAVVALPESLVDSKDKVLLFRVLKENLPKSK